MSSQLSPSNSRYSEDVQDIVKQQMDTLHKQAMEIAVVETRLAALRQEYNRLREELSPYLHTTIQMDSAKATHPFTNVTIGAPIHCCPQDILYVIFAFYLARDHQQIRTLLLVCKDWNYFVMNSPKLWTRLHIMDAYDLFDLKTRRSKESYILACMERSCDLKLDVRLDLQNFPDQFFLAREEIIACALDVLPKAQHQQFRELFDDGPLYFTAKHYTTQMERALERLVGPQGKHLERWGMLNLILPATSCDNIRERIWRSLVNVTPSLAAFEIRNPPESWDGVFPGLPEALYPDLSAAKKSSYT
jgi:F-box-like